jgi:hypothetical protein
MDGKRGAGLVVALALLGGAIWYLSPVPAGSPAGQAALPEPEIPGAVLLNGLDGFNYPITANTVAQRWFNQGMVLTYGFNHDAAARSFLMGTQADENCAMCWWTTRPRLGRACRTRCAWPTA